jgi:hypothetical protein
MWPNFGKLPEMATGEYFSWLQDDDLIHRDFARRAAETFARDESIVVYAGFGAWSPSPTSMYFPKMTGPLFPVNWMGGEMGVFDGVAIAPIAHFIPPLELPQIAFRTDVIRRAVRNLRPNCDLFNENIVMASALVQGKLAIDPWVCAIHRNHDRQAHKVIMKDMEDSLKQWRELAAFFQDFLAKLPDHWKSSFMEILREIPVCNRIAVLIDACPFAGDWETTPAAARELKAMIIESIPEEGRGEMPTWITTTALPSTTATRLKQMIKRVLPPWVVRVIQAIRSLR